MIKPRKPADFNDLEILARTIWGEARSETLLGRRTVACVVINRWLSGKWFNGTDTNNDEFESIAEVCKQPWQFSCWNSNDKNLPKMMAVRIGDRLFDECINIAMMVIEDAGSLRRAGRDPSCGATHYYVDGSPVPKWHTGQKPCAIIGKHLFFANIN